MKFHGHFKNMEIPLEVRQKQSVSILKKYPGRIPVICAAGDTFKLNKSKFLINDDLHVGHLHTCIRKHLALDYTQGLFLFFYDKANRQPTLIAQTTSMKEVYQACRDDDGFLYVLLLSQGTFG